MLKLKLQYFGHLMWRTDSLEKNPDAEKDWRQGEKGMTEDKMVGCHHWLSGHEFELGVGDGQRGLTCCSLWGRKELDMTEWLNWLTKCHRCFSGFVYFLSLSCWLHFGISGFLWWSVLISFFIFCDSVIHFYFMVTMWFA